jgi:hypothetical protein
MDVSGFVLLFRAFYKIEQQIMQQNGICDAVPEANAVSYPSGTRGHTR